MSLGVECIYLFTRVGLQSLKRVKVVVVVFIFYFILEVGEIWIGG